MMTQQDHNPLKLLNLEKPWYSNGLPFECTGCGKCCSGPKGDVFVNEQEISEMASTLNISIEHFKKRFSKIRNQRFCLTHKKSKITPGDYDCIFLKDNKCEVYKSRPTQCKTFPWWSENLNTKESFYNLPCEGIHKTATLVPFEEIQDNLLLN